MAVSTTKTSTSTKKPRETKTTAVKTETTSDCCTENSQGSKRCNTSNIMHILIIGLLALNLLVGIVNITSNNVADIIRQNEAMKVGGEENYEKLQKIMQSDSYKERYTQNIDMTLMQIEQAANGNTMQQATGDDSQETPMNTISSPEEQSNPESRGDE